MMTVPAHRVNHHALSISFSYNGTVAVGDRVEIASGRMVQRLTAIGTGREVGTVIAVREALRECTVASSFRENRQDRIAGQDCGLGPFVFGPDNTAYPYIKAAPAMVNGTTVGPKTVTAATDDAVKLKLEGGGSQMVTLTAGAGRTFAQIAAELNAVLTGMVAEVDADGNLNVAATQLGKTIEVEAVTHDAYTLLGWAVGVVHPVNANHDAAAVAGLIIVGANQGNALETLEY